MASLTPWIDQKFYLADGITPNAGGKVFTYEPGTTTKKTTYVSESGAANTNPIILNAAGECNLWFGAGGYKVVNAPANDTDPPASAIKTWDDINVSGGTSESQGIVDTIAELKGLDEGSFDIVQVLGYNSAGDGGGGLFRWNSTSVVSDNGGTIIAPTVSDGVGRWYRVYDGAVNSAWFGTVGDGVTADNTAFTNANTFANLNNGTDLYIPDGIYLLNSNFSFSSKVRVVFSAGAYFIAGSAVTVTFNGKIEAGLTKIFGTNISVSFVGKMENVYPEWFGAVGDASTDDSEPVQNTIDSVTQVDGVSRGYSKVNVVLSSIYAVSSTIEVYNKFGFRIIGTGGAKQVGFKWIGATSATAVVLDTSNIYYCEFEGFDVDADSKAGIAWLIDNKNVPSATATYPIQTHMNFFNRIMARNGTTATMKIGQTGTTPGSVLINLQIDWLYFTNCHLGSAAGGKLLYVQGSNTFHMTWRGGEINDFTGYGIHLESGGQFHFDGVGLNSGGSDGGTPVGTYFYRSPYFGTLSVKRCQQEGAALTLLAPDDSGSANNSPIIFEGNNFGYTGATESSLTAYKLVDYRQRGVFSSTSDKWGANPTNSVLGQLYFNIPGSAGGNVIINGLYISAAELEVITAGNTLVSGFSKGGILSGMVRFLMNTAGRTIAGLSHFMQIEKPGEKASFSLSSNTEDASGSIITTHKSRGATLGSNTIVQSGDSVGLWQGAASDGVDAESTIASINFVVDGTPGANDTPGRIEISTTPDGSSSPVKRWVIDNLGKYIGYNASAVFKMLIDPINARIQIGNATSRTIASTAGQVQVEGVSAATGGHFIRNSADATGASLILAKTRSTAAGTNTIVQNGDSLGKYVWAAADGSDIDSSSAFIEVVINGTPGANDLPTDMILNTCRVGNNDATETLRLTAGGKVLASDPLGGIGYRTGAGGTVTQATNKSTGVTLNRVCGEITMNNASLAADTVVSFTLTNTAIAATDVLILNHASVGTVGAYSFNAQCAAGSAVISVRNLTAGALAEAIVIRYVLFKAVNA